jgi:purine-nucleoside phosphorylase
MADFYSRVQVEEAAAVIRSRTRYEPGFGLVLGSGLSGLADALEEPDIVPYEQIPNWPASTVAGHRGRLILGKLEGQIVLVQQGRAHFYEGYSPSHITLPIKVMRALGITTVILTNAAGGLNETFTPGDVMLIKDHINLPGLAGNNPLRGPNDDVVGPRFPDMTEPYDPALRRLAHEVAASEGFSLQEGIYVHVAGPSYETPAELRFLQTIGGDAVGMSTVPEVVVARHAGMRTLAISTITNLALPDPPAGTTLTHDEVLAAGKIAVPRLTRLLHGLLRRL